MLRQTKEAKLFFPLLAINCVHTREDEAEAVLLHTNGVDLELVFHGK